MRELEPKIIMDVTDPDNGKVIGPVPDTIANWRLLLMWITKVFGTTKVSKLGDDFIGKAADGRTIETFDLDIVNEGFIQQNGQGVEDNLGWGWNPPNKN